MENLYIVNDIKIFKSMNCNTYTYKFMIFIVTSRTDKNFYKTIRDEATKNVNVAYIVYCSKNMPGKFEIGDDTHDILGEDGKKSDSIFVTYIFNEFSSKSSNITEFMKTQDPDIYSDDLDRYVAAKKYAALEKYYMQKFNEL